MLLQAVAKYGRSWANIAKTYFPSRTGLALKNRYVFRPLHCQKQHSDGIAMDRFVVIGPLKPEGASLADQWTYSDVLQRSNRRLSEPEPVVELRRHSLEDHAEGYITSSEPQHQVHSDLNNSQGHESLQEKDDWLKTGTRQRAMRI